MGMVGAEFPWGSGTAARVRRDGAIPGENRVAALPASKNVKDLRRLIGDREYCSADQFVAALKQCSKLRDLECGKKLHSKAVGARLQENSHVAANLITMYSKCRCMPLAQQVFNGLFEQDVVIWSSIMLGYVENRQNEMALNLFSRMDCEPDSFTYNTVLKAYAGLASDKHADKRFCLENAIQIHRRIEARGFDSNIVVATSLVDMYSKWGCMFLAQEVFDKFAFKDAAIWNSLIQGYMEEGENLLALELFSVMDCEPSSRTYAIALKACARLASQSDSNLERRCFCLQKGMTIHRQAKERALDSDIYVASTLVDMYSKCGSIKHAREVFDRMSYKNVVVWTSLLRGYVQNGKSPVALDLFTRMDCEPTSATYAAALKACGGLACEKESEKRSCLEKGIFIHKQVRELGFDSDIAVAGTLVEMYAKCGNMELARNVFDGMVCKSVVEWSSLILGYANNGESLVALDLFSAMDCEPNSFTYVAALKACASLASDKECQKQFCLDKGTEIHRQARERGIDTNVYVASTLLDMYCKCSNMGCAREVFDRMVFKDVVIWTSLILAYVENGESEVAMDLFTRMDCQPDSLTYSAVLKACGGLASEKNSEKQFWLEKGIGIHKQLKNDGIDGDLVLANNLVDMYSKCDSMDRAREVFDKMVLKTTASWNTLILGYLENGQDRAAVDLFMGMDSQPDHCTFITVLKACGNLVALADGQGIHARICKAGFEHDLAVATTLMNFYRNCGSMSRAEEIFNNIKSPDVVAWTTLIAGSGGDSSRLFDLVKKMQEAGLQMDEAIFINVLTACSHGGFVEEGRLYFESMSRYGVSANLAHYNCMVDMLARAQRVDEALALVKSMPFEADKRTWSILLKASVN